MPSPPPHFTASRLLVHVANHLHNRHAPSCSTRPPNQDPVNNLTAKASRIRAVHKSRISRRPNSNRSSRHQTPKAHTPLPVIRAPIVLRALCRFTAMRDASDNRPRGGAPALLRNCQDTNEPHSMVSTSHCRSSGSGCLGCGCGARKLNPKKFPRFTTSLVVPSSFIRRGKLLASSTNPSDTASAFHFDLLHGGRVGAVVEDGR